jgi:hypothetical protein
MNVSPGWSERIAPRSDVPVSPELRAFAHIEGLVGEELALLGIPENERTPEQHRRLRAIAAELDRLWDALRERAERLAGARDDEPGRATG